MVVATGLRSTFGRIAALTQHAHEEPSPLLLAFARLGNVVLLVGTLVALSAYTYAVAQLGLSQPEAISIAILCLTAAVPTGLMPGITLTLIEGARRLQTRQAIFRRLSNVETLGATTVICADKTGTLTQNEMTVREVWTAEGVLTISGVGYQPQGQFSSEQRMFDSAQTQQQAGALLHAAVLTSSARLLPPDTLRPKWHIVGDPVEAAYLAAATKAGIKPAAVYDRAPQLAVLQSDRQLGLDGVIVDEPRQPMMYFKGSALELLNRCTSIVTESGERPMTDRDRQTAKRTLQRFGRDAMRTIAFARRPIARHDVDEIDLEHAAQQLALLGLIAVVDPPRQEVAAAIRACHDAKIRTIMLTSDDTIGATSLARRCDLARGPQSAVLSGPQLETMDDAALKEYLRTGNIVLARLSPEHKVRVVETLTALGEVVLVTGGAASDVPALKAAYTGIAMGATGSAAATQAADLILLDDNFATIAAAIAEGRSVEQRVRRLVALNLATTVVKLLALLASLVFGLPLLLTVGQQLLIDFLAGLLPGLAIGAGQPDPRLMHRSPRPTGRPLLSRKMYTLGYGVFGLLGAGFALLGAFVFLTQVPDQNGALSLTDLLVNNLRPYSERVLTEPGQRGLIATSLYLVTGVAALLGIAAIPRSVAPHDRRPLVLLLSLIGLSFVLLVGVILFEPLHRYIALAAIPTWGWIAAGGALVLASSLERLRQRLDPIYKTRGTPEAAKPIRNVSSPNKG